MALTCRVKEPSTASIGDIRTAANSVLFDHLVGESEELGGNIEAERLGSLEIDHNSNLVGLNDRQVSRLFALEDATGIDARLAMRIGKVRSVAHQATRRGKLAHDIDRRHSMGAANPTRRSR